MVCQLFASQQRTIVTCNESSKADKRSGYLYPYCATGIFNFSPYQYTAYACDSVSTLVTIEVAGNEASGPIPEATITKTAGAVAEQVTGGIIYNCENGSNCGNTNTNCENGSNCGNDDTNGGNKNGNGSAASVAIPAASCLRLLCFLWISLLIWYG